MYVIVKGCPRIPEQKIANIISDRLAYTVDDDLEGEYREDGSYEGSRIVVIGDEAREGSIEEGGLVDYNAISVGSCGIARYRGFDFNPNKPKKTVLQAANDLRKYLTEKGYTGWEISEVYE